jgi:hypothetical protein
MAKEDVRAAARVSRREEGYEVAAGSAFGAEDAEGAEGAAQE